MSSLRVEIPMLPPKECNPNWRGHWSDRYRETSQFRLAAGYCAVASKQGKPLRYCKAKVSITLVIPDRRYVRDTDNMLASLKPAIDGCVDAGVLPGDSPENLEYTLPIKYVISKVAEPMTILEFEEVE